MIRWLKSLFRSTSDSITLETLKGKWRMVSVGKNGNFAPAKMILDARIFMIIEGDRYTIITEGQNADEGTIKLDVSKKPVHFDQHVTSGDDAGSTHLGIIRFRDGMLENFQGDNGCPRPKEFTRIWNDGASLAAFRRVE